MMLDMIKKIHKKPIYECIIYIIKSFSKEKLVH
jgi:hypothetical protein